MSVDVDAEMLGFAIRTVLIDVDKLTCVDTAKELEVETEA
jgi:hypothetical protein